MLMAPSIQHNTVKTIHQYNITQLKQRDENSLIIVIQRGQFLFLILMSSIPIFFTVTNSCWCFPLSFDQDMIHKLLISHRHLKTYPLGISSNDDTTYFDNTDFGPEGNQQRVLMPLLSLWANIREIMNNSLRKSDQEREVDINNMEFSFLLFHMNNIFFCEAT